MKLDFDDSVRNTSEIKAFVAAYQLQAPNSTILFPAIMDIRTSTRSLNLQFNVTIQFGGYENAGIITIMDPNRKIDPLLFPENFDANWQRFSYEGEYLKITGLHKSNPKIGKYEVKIFPV